MKKLCVAVLIFLVLGTIAVGGYTVIDKLFPLAKPIAFPEVGESTSISITRSNGASLTVIAEEFEMIVDGISDSKPTRKMSVNDHPTVDEYYTVVIEGEDRAYRYYVYEEGSKVYVEVPYDGIYLSDMQFLDSIASYSDGYLSVAGQSFKYEKDGFGGDFTITVNEDGSFSYCVGLLSSYIGDGSWKITDGRITLTDQGDLGFKNTFEINSGRLIWLEEESTGFMYMEISDGAVFTKNEIKECFMYKEGEKL